MKTQSSNAAATHQSPEIYWQPDPESNRAFLCLAGHDNNLAEVFAVDCPGFQSAHDNAARIGRTLNAVPELLLALQKIDANAAESVEWIRRVAREAIARATQSPL